MLVMRSAQNNSNNNSMKAGVNNMMQAMFRPTSGNVVDGGRAVDVAQGEQGAESLG